jgi:Tol biopolymer transport system component
MTPLEKLHRYAIADEQRLGLEGFEHLKRRRGASRFPRVLAATVALVLIAIVGAQVGLGLRRAATPDGASAPVGTSGSPSTSPAATVAAPLFRGLGKLAFATSGLGLQVLDGGGGGVTRIDAAALAWWSFDGGWLAYVRGGVVSPASELWLSRADGSGKQKVGGLPEYTNVVVGWSPTDNVLAVIPQGGTSSGLWLVRPDAATAPLVAADTMVLDVAWSPDGKTLAYSRTLPATDPSARSDALLTISVSGGAPSQRLVARDAGLLGITWWPDGRGLLYYRDPQHSSSLLVDGVPLESLAFAGSRPSGAFPDRKLTTSGQWVDDHRFVALTGAGRWPTANKNLAICDIETLRCTVVGQAAGSVALEPALSPDRGRIAFVRAADRGNATGFSSDADAQQWLASRTLWMLDLGSGQTHELIGAGRGVLMPAWSADGRQLLLTRDRAAWLYDLSAARAAQVIAPLDPPMPFGSPGWMFAWKW